MIRDRDVKRHETLQNVITILLWDRVTLVFPVAGQPLKFKRHVECNTV